MGGRGAEGGDTPRIGPPTRPFGGPQTSCARTGRAGETAAGAGLGRWGGRRRGEESARTNQSCPEAGFRGVLGDKCGSGGGGRGRALAGSLPRLACGAAPPRFFPGSLSAPKPPRREGGGRRVGAPGDFHLGPLTAPPRAPRTRRPRAVPLPAGCRRSSVAAGDGRPRPAGARPLPSPRRRLPRLGGCRQMLLPCCPQESGVARGGARGEDALGSIVADWSSPGPRTNALRRSLRPRPCGGRPRGGRVAGPARGPPARPLDPSRGARVHCYWRRGARAFARRSFLSKGISWGQVLAS